MRHVRPHDFGPEHMDRMDRIGGYGDGIFFGGFLYLLLIALLVTAVVLLAINMRRGNLRTAGQSPAGAVMTRDPAVENARMRLSRGEINREEFDEINQALGGESPPGPSGQT